MKYTILTENQKRILEVILSYVKTNGISPTIREIQKISGLRSLRGVTLQLDALEAQGFITKKVGARGIAVNPSLLEPSEDKEISINLFKAKEEEELRIDIPLMTTTISAGYGNLAEEHIEQQIPIPLSAARGMTNVFAVKVSGDSMINSGINDGDIAIIAPQPIANDGDIVAAYFDGGVTLKKFRMIENRPMLVPANPNYQPITSQFQITGKLVNVIKPDDK